MRSLLLAIVLTSFAGADPVIRWRLDFEPGNLERMGEYQAIPFTISNPMKTAVVLSLEIELHYGPGRFARTGFFPGVRENFGRESHRSMSELRGMSLLPGASEKGIALFRVTEEDAPMEIRVAGLVDPVAEETRTWSQTRFYMEKRVLRIALDDVGRTGKTDWFVGPLSPLLKQDDISRFLEYLVSDDPLVRRLALNLLKRFTFVTWPPSGETQLVDVPPAQVQQMLAAKAEVKRWTEMSADARRKFCTELKTRIPELPAGVNSLKVTDEIADTRSLAADLKQLVESAMELRIPLPGDCASVLSTADPSPQDLRDWICGRPGAPGIQQWREFLDDLFSDAQFADFNVASAFTEALCYQEGEDRRLVLSIVMEICVDSELAFDTSKFDPKLPLKDQPVEVRQGIARWTEWWNRFGGDCVWHPELKRFVRQ